VGLIRGVLPNWAEAFSGYGDGDGDGDGSGSGDGYGDGSGSGYGYGYGDGYGDGSGSGYGYGYGDGSGSGDGDGSGSGSGDGYGSGYGDGYGDGSGYGYGYGDGDGDGDGSGSGYGDGSGSGSGDGYWRLIAARFAAEWEHVKGFIAFWKSDKDGLPSNGGHETDNARPGLVRTISGPLEICTRRALHGTLSPDKWKGERLWIVALRGEIQGQDDKVGALEREIICEVTSATS